MIRGPSRKYQVLAMGSFQGPLCRNYLSLVKMLKKNVFSISVQTTGKCKSMCLSSENKADHYYII